MDFDPRNRDRNDYAHHIEAWWVDLDGIRELEREPGDRRDVLDRDRDHNRAFDARDPFVSSLELPHGHDR
jgi:hypothetical protein